jgi:hypothetical protein
MRMGSKTTLKLLLAGMMVFGGCLDRKHGQDGSAPSEAGAGPDSGIVGPLDGPVAGAEVRVEVPVDGAAVRLDAERSVDVGVDLSVAPDLRLDMTSDLPQDPETAPDVPAEKPSPIDVVPDSLLVPDSPPNASPDMVADLPLGPEATPDVPPAGCVIGGTAYANGVPNPGMGARGAA